GPPTPTSTQSPAPIAPVTLPSTVTLASLTRCTTARTGRSISWSSEAPGRRSRQCSRLRQPPRRRRRHRPRQRSRQRQRSPTPSTSWFPRKSPRLVLHRHRLGRLPRIQRLQQRRHVVRVLLFLGEDLLHQPPRGGIVVP